MCRPHARVHLTRGGVGRVVGCGLLARSQLLQRFHELVVVVAFALPSDPHRRRRGLHCFPRTPRGAQAARLDVRLRRTLQCGRVSIELLA
ncbi:MAG: hypothetical protein ABSG64_13950 [Solirubrobacteraceae bacterium]